MKTKSGRNIIRMAAAAATSKERFKRSDGARFGAESSPWNLFHFADAAKDDVKFRGTIQPLRSQFNGKASRSRTVELSAINQKSTNVCVLQSYFSNQFIGSICVEIGDPHRLEVPVKQADAAVRPRRVLGRRSNGGSNESLLNLFQIRRDFCR